jgi:hypothetical protein
LLVDVEAPMGSSSPLQNPAAWLMGLFRRTNPTDAFLRSRNARLTVQDGEGHSFHVVRLTSRCDVVAAGKPIRVRVRLVTDQLVRVTLEDRNAKTTLIDVSTPVDPSAGTMDLNYGDIHLKLDIDAASSSEKLPR